MYVCVGEREGGERKTETDKTDKRRDENRHNGKNETIKRKIKAHSNIEDKGQ